MKKIEGEVGYELQASEGMELVIIKNKKEVARCKSVVIPPGDTKHTWTEVPEIIPVPIPEPTEDEINQRRIEELEAELEQLRT